jgi:Flp pilus assembly protein TadD
VIEKHLREVPEDARARTLLAIDYAELGRTDDANREANLAAALRPNEATVLYNLACVFAKLGRPDDAIAALSRAWEGGFKDPAWARRDPDLISLHGQPEFERLYPAE